MFDDSSDRRKGTVAGDEADLCRPCDIFFSYLRVVFCFLVMIPLSFLPAVRVFVV